MVPLRFKRLSPHATLPKYQSKQASGMDLHAALEEPVMIEVGGIARIPCGFAVAVPDGHEAQIRPRSGLAIRHGVSLLNSPGTIDSDYRGEIKVILANLGGEPMTIRRGDRIAQLVISRFEQIQWEAVEELGSTLRSAGGFGHTGKR